MNFDDVVINSENMIEIVVRVMVSVHGKTKLNSIPPLYCFFFLSFHSDLGLLFKGNQFLNSVINR